MRIILLVMLLMAHSAWSKNLDCKAKVADKNYLVKIEDFADLKSRELRIFKNSLLLKKCLLVSPTSKKLERNGLKKEVINYVKTECTDFTSNQISLKDNITLVVSERTRNKSYYLHFENSIDGVLCK